MADWGCPYGASCRRYHPKLSPQDGKCFNCGSTQHSSKDCDRARKPLSKDDRDKINQDIKGKGKGKGKNKDKPNVPNPAPKAQPTSSPSGSSAIVKTLADAAKDAKLAQELLRQLSQTTTPTGQQAATFVSGFAIDNKIFGNMMAASRFGDSRKDWRYTEAVNASKFKFYKKDEVDCDHKEVKVTVIGQQAFLKNIKTSRKPMKALLDSGANQAAMYHPDSVLHEEVYVTLADGKKVKLGMTIGETIMLPYGSQLILPTIKMGIVLKTIYHNDEHGVSFHAYGKPVLVHLDKGLSVIDYDLGVSLALAMEVEILKIRKRVDAQIKVIKRNESDPQTEEQLKEVSNLFSMASYLFRPFEDLQDLVHGELNVMSAAPSSSDNESSDPIPSFWNDPAFEVESEEWVTPKRINSPREKTTAVVSIPVSNTFSVLSKDAIEFVPGVLAQVTEQQGEVVRDPTARGSDEAPPTVAETKTAVTADSNVSITLLDTAKGSTELRVLHDDNTFKEGSKFFSWLCRSCSALGEGEKPNCCPKCKTRSDKMYYELYIGQRPVPSIEVVEDDDSAKLFNIIPNGPRDLRIEFRDENNKLLSTRGVRQAAVYHTLPDHLVTSMWPSVRSVVTTDLSGAEVLRNVKIVPVRVDTKGEVTPPSLHSVKKAKVNKMLHSLHQANRRTGRGAKLQQAASLQRANELRAELRRQQQGIEEASQEAFLDSEGEEHLFHPWDHYMETVQCPVYPFDSPHPFESDPGGWLQVVWEAVNENTASQDWFVLVQYITSLAVLHNNFLTEDGQVDLNWFYNQWPNLNWYRMTAPDLFLAEMNNRRYSHVWWNLIVKHGRQEQVTAPLSLGEQYDVNALMNFQGIIQFVPLSYFAKVYAGESYIPNIGVIDALCTS